MCRLITVGSGSKGNTYLLQCGDEVLVLDCGMRFMDVKKALKFNIRGIVGAVVTHVHGDHHAFAHEYETAGIPVWKPYETESLRQSRQMGGFSVQSFPVTHSVPTVGYLIGHERLGKMLYVTDASYVKYTFRNLNAILIEANWSDKYVDKEKTNYHHVVRDHMNISVTEECIRANINQKLHTVILCHVSDSNGNANEFRETINDATPPWARVYLAEPGAMIDLSEIPF